MFLRIIFSFFSDHYGLGVFARVIPVFGCGYAALGSLRLKLRIQASSYFVTLVRFVVNTVFFFLKETVKSTAPSESVWRGPRCRQGCRECPVFRTGYNKSALAVSTIDGSFRVSR